MRGTPGAVQQISLHLPYDWGKPRKTSVRKSSEALANVTSHCFEWGLFPPNEIGRATLPTPLAKIIGSSQKSVFKNFRSQDSGTAPPGHSSWEHILLRGMNLERSGCLSTGIGYVPASGLILSFSFIILLIIIPHKTHTTRNNYTYSLSNLTSFCTQIQIHIPSHNVVAQEMHESKIHNTNAIYPHSAEPEARCSAEKLKQNCKNNW